MNKKLIKALAVLILYAPLAWSADNEIYVDQNGGTANIDLEQLGSGNIIGGLSSSAGSLTAFDLDGTSLTLDINQIGSTNKFLGDITGNSITGFFEFSGDTNTFTIQGDPTATYGINNSNYNVAVTGSTNTFTLDFDINYDLGTSYVDVDGDSNTLNFTGSGYQGGYFYIDQTGNSRTFNIQQLSTQDNDWLKIITNGNGGTVCVIQNDQGTSTSC
jgi:hypothetical protein